MNKLRTIKRIKDTHIFTPAVKGRIYVHINELRTINHIKDTHIFTPVLVLTGRI